MRIMTSCLLLSSLILLSGCEWMKKGHKQGPGPVNNLKDQGYGPPTAEQLVSYLNKEADRLTSLESSDISIVTTVQKQRLPGLTGFMVAEKSRNFRLTGDALSTQYVDIGSNNNQFWFWVKDGDAPLYYCSYDNYEKGVKLPMPFQPEWVVQALGMAKYDPTRSYKVELKRDTYELIENTTVQGQPVRKITVFTSAPIKDATYPQVIAHIVQDAATGKTICQASIRRMRPASYRTAEGEANVSYPSDILLEWPAEQMSMTMKIGKATVNKRITNEEASRYFTLPSWPGIKSVDLANMPLRGNPTSRDIRQAGGIR
ncbi:MAG: hypothetical protein K8T89_06610 [Planctomycetes bacterium]|nr:hypothetical protein [Planctomycetota bacterium]